MKRKEILVLFFILLMLSLMVGCAPPVIHIGFIDVNSTPSGAKVYLDGEDTGMVTPIILTNVEAGIHTIKLDKFHYKIWGEGNNVTVNENETSYLNPPLTYALEEIIALQPGGEGKDSCVGEARPFTFTNFGSIEALRTGWSNTKNSMFRAYLQFDLDLVPEGVIVTNGNLKLYQYDSSGSGSFTVGLYEVTDYWNEFGITWNHQPDSSSVAETSCNITIGSIGWESWDIDNLVQGWLDGSIINYGMLLKPSNETIISVGAVFSSFDYYFDSSKHPILEINYYIP